MLDEQPRVVDRDIFIVHAGDDTPFIKGELLPTLGLPDDRVILSSELPFPAFIEQAIERSVRRSRLTLAVLSPAYLRDRWASFAELLSRNVNDDGRDGGSLVPLLIADCEVPQVLAQHATLDGRTPRGWEASAARLRTRLGRPEPVASPIACPYPGMRPFSIETASQFRGRTREVEELLGRLRAGEQEIYVIGPSGSGKSSLVSAGVLSCLRAAGGKLDGRSFAVRVIRPGEDPTRRLAEALACDVNHREGAASRLLERVRRDRLLVIIDQFEELFALSDARERDRFACALRMLRADRRCQLIVALRADFYGALMSSELWPDIDGRFSRLEVAPLRGDALREAIEAPAREAGVYFERVLVERLMSDAATEPGALPLLQEALVLLWERRIQRLLRVASYEELGSDGRSGLAVALAKRADATFHSSRGHRGGRAPAATRAGRASTTASATGAVRRPRAHRVLGRGLGARAGRMARANGDPAPARAQRAGAGAGADRRAPRSDQCDSASGRGGEPRRRQCRATFPPRRGETRCMEDRSSSWSGSANRGVQPGRDALGDSERRWDCTRVERGHRDTRGRSPQARVTGRQGNV